MGENQLLELTGSVEQVIYRNEKNGYTVLSLLAGDGEVPAVGTLPWVNDPALFVIRRREGDRPGHGRKAGRRLRRSNP